MNKLGDGFSLLEIVIVLAIASFIMIVVFFAVQGAQRSQRDSFRKDVANRASAAVSEYRGHNNGSIPSSPDQLTNYVSNVSSQGITVDFNSANTPESCPAGSGGTQALWLTESDGIISANICLEQDSTPYSRSAG
jgi:prepilin-type N-terminal cleavage/methylation domain-containing protein